MRIAPSLLVLLFISGCSASGQLANVAKDWCRSIRASQIVPVYPLTEDVQPGDVFLVSTPIGAQQVEYRKRGFLPIENLIGRLPVEYGGMYSGAYGIGAFRDTPHHWQFPPAGDTMGWAQAPLAGFPSYKFEVRNGSGLSLGVPVRSVPIGLSVLNSSQADGFIQIAEAHTYGIEMALAYAKLADWGAGHQDLLAQLANAKDDECTRAGSQCSYLRVVSRVYVARRVNVLLSSAQFGGAGLTAGRDPLPNIASQSTSASAAYDTINAIIRKNLSSEPGGAVQVVSAAARSVSLEERFPRPLVIGYIGFDVPILPGGELGAPVPTRSIMEGRPISPSQTLQMGAPDTFTFRLKQLLQDPQKRERARTWLRDHGHADLVPNDIVFDSRYANQRRALVHFLEGGKTP